MRLSVLLFSTLRDRLGRDALDVELPDGARAEDLLGLLGREHAAIAALAPQVRLAVNHRYAGPDAPLADGDEVALITPTSGG